MRRHHNRCCEWAAMKSTHQKVVRARRRELALQEKGFNGGPITRMSMRNGTSMPTDACLCRMALVSNTRRSMRNGTSMSTRSVVSALLLKLSSPK